MSPFKLKLLGQMECQLPSGELLSLSTRKSEVLLAYLALAPGIRHSRDRLVNLLWSDRGEDQARNSLRQSLSSLKKTLDKISPGLLDIERTTIRLNAEKLNVDVLEFKLLVGESDLEGLRKAANLYQGEFLEGMAIRDPACEQWLAEERGNLKRLYVDGLSRLSRLQLDALDFDAAIQSAERLVAIDSLDEMGWRMLMSAYQQKGNRNHALMAYKRCSEVLQTELSIEPEAETRELQQSIKEGQFLPELENRLEHELTDRPVPLTVSDNKDHNIFVLPFKNLSNDDSQQYFSDGLTESIIMGLSLFPSLKVHSRHSSFAASDQQLSVRQIGENFQAQFVVEGSVRKLPDQIRVSAQLVNTQTGEQIWGNRFDNKLSETFTLEDQLTRSIVAAIKGKIDVTDQNLAIQKPTKDMQSYDFYLRGRYHLIRFNPKDNRIGIEYLIRCLEIDSENAAARNDLYRCYILDWLSAWTAPRSECLDKAGFQIRKAMELEPDSSFIRASYAEYLIFSGEFEQAETHLDRALKLNPNDTEAIATISAVQASLGHIESALDLADTCRQLDPFHPWVDWVTGIAYYRGKRYEDAIKTFRNMPNPADEIDGWVAACHQRLGEHEKATRHLNLYLETARKNMEDFPQSMDDWNQIWSSAASFNHQEGIDYPFEALCEAGLADLVEQPVKKVASVEMHNIAALPFDNLSGDPEQEYFSDGITESIILNLSLFPGLNVKSRNSSFAFKQQIKNLGEISKELNVDYVVEGSIRKSDERIRITVQLIETANGNQIWGKRYDAELIDLFTLEEDLSRTIAATVTGQIESDLQRIALTKGAAHHDSYNLLLGGIYHLNKITQVDLGIAIEKLNKCLHLDPENIRAHVAAYNCHSINMLERWVVDPEGSFLQAGEHIKKALSLGPEIGIVQAAYAEYLVFCSYPSKALEYANKALQTNPNDPDALTVKAFALEMLGEHENALKLAELAQRLDPYHPWVAWNLTECQIFSGYYEQALATISMANNATGLLKIYSVVANIKLGRKQAAKEALKGLLQECRVSMLSMPNSLDEWLAFTKTYIPLQDSSVNQDLIDCLVQAGLRDELTEQNGDMPSIAVLPFENMSGDPEQEFFSDGITTDIISTLSKFQHMRIVARHSILQYKHQKASIAEIADQQNVRYILEGSIRKSGSRIRVNAQLIDTHTGENCWVENYDRNLDDVFAVQDDITQNITVAMKVHLSDGDRARVRASGTSSIKAWEYCTVATDLIDSYIHDNSIEARRIIDAALKLDPNYSYAWVLLGWAHWQDAYCSWGDAIDESLQAAQKAAEKALSLVPDDTEALLLSSNILIMQGRHEEAIKAAKRAVGLEPGNADIQALTAYAYNYAGQYDNALAHYEAALRLSPVYPAWYLLIGGYIHFFAGRLDEAVKTFRKGVEIEPDSPLVRLFLMDVLIEQGEENTARQIAEDIRSLDPSITVSGFIRACSYDVKERNRLEKNLAKMGFVA